MTQFILSSAKVAVIAIVFAFSVSGQTTFAGNGPGQIPDSNGSSSCQSPGAPLDVTFNVTGVPSGPSSISLTISFSPNHTWGGDVTARLISPDSTSFVIFGNTGISTNEVDDGGDGSILAGPYTFEDTATNNWWNAAATTDDEAPIAPGIYRSSALGGLGSSGEVTNLNAAFAGIPTSNGTWTLRFTDGCSADTGGVGSASLTLAANSGTPPQKPNVDMNGDNRSDFVILRQGSGSLTSSKLFSNARSFRERRKNRIRNTSVPSSTSDIPIEWWVQFQGGGGLTVEWGDASQDEPIPADFDGDGMDDIAIWRPGPPTIAAFYWVTSGDFVYGSVPFGQEGDETSIVGDYDADGIDDPASFRCEGGGQCYFFYTGSNSPGSTVQYIPWGFGDSLDYYTYPGDFDGDGRYDFCLVAADEANPAQSVFILLRSSDLGGEWIRWGLFSDVTIPGDFDGDGKSDFSVQRVEGGRLYHYVLERDGGTQSVQWGLADDFPAPGDYDGDGKQDFAIYRWGTPPENSQFWVLRSGGGIEVVTFGLSGDLPAAFWYTGYE